jgi:malate dehydrogenase
MSVISAADVERARDVLVLANTDVVTPLARDRAKELGVRIERAAVTASSSPAAPHAPQRASVAADTALVERDR